MYIPITYHRLVIIYIALEQNTQYEPVETINLLNLPLAKV